MMRGSVPGEYWWALLGRSMFISRADTASNEMTSRLVHEEEEEDMRYEEAIGKRRSKRGPKYTSSLLLLPSSSSSSSPPPPPPPLLLLLLLSIFLYLSTHLHFSMYSTTGYVSLIPFCIGMPRQYREANTSLYFWICKRDNLHPHIVLPYSLFHFLSFQLFS